MIRTSNALRVLPLLTALLLWRVQVAAGQETRPRQGFWAAVGLGYGVNSMGCGGGCTVNPELKGGSATVSLQMGGTVKHSLRGGGEVNVWVKGLSGGGTGPVGHLSAAAHLLP